MLSRSQTKYLNSLQLNKYRSIHQEFIAEGNKLVLDLLSAELEIKEIFASQKWLEKNLPEYDRSNIKATEITEKDLKKMIDDIESNEGIEAGGSLLTKLGLNNLNNKNGNLPAKEGEGDE